ncbi:hypothetical protein NL676_007102 [Syzygium grande]|nr:hypothetical protein NL676_007102 [Syzygium grande]
MGVYCPPRILTPEFQSLVMRPIILPTVEGMAVEGCKFVGILYAGLMIEKKSRMLKLIDYNVHFGGPNASWRSCSWVTSKEKLEEAHEIANQAVEAMNLPGRFCWQDIGWRALPKEKSAKQTQASETLNICNHHSSTSPPSLSTSASSLALSTTISPAFASRLADSNSLHQPLRLLQVVCDRIPFGNSVPSTGNLSRAMVASQRSLQ